MRCTRTFFLILLATLLLTSCGSVKVAPALTPTPLLSPQARAYLTAALDDMQRLALDSKDVNWPKLRQQAFTLARGAKTASDTYPAISFALSWSGTLHSFLIAPSDLRRFGLGGDLTPDEEPHGQRLASGIGYLELPHINGSRTGSSDQATQQYGMLAQEAIRRVDQGGTCGWIVDLRRNSGGDMWPMLAGVGPILGEGTVGWFVYPDGRKQAWAYDNGQAQGNGVTQEGVANAYHLKRPFPPVAVLTGQYTGSAGEAIVVAFRARPHTQSFGRPTYGVPTGNIGPIAPDRSVAFSQEQIGSAADPVVKAALAWLHLQPQCQS
jgi:carboxyl-terminal processing protease